jgi:hypothetical protein
MCDGASLDEIRFHLHGLIQRVGWAVVPVVGDRPGSSCAYTIGLVEQGRPEIAVVGLAPESAGRLLNFLGRMVSEGHQFRAGESTVRIRNKEYRFFRVHDRHFVKHTFALWVDYYCALGSSRPSPSALEVVRRGHAPKLGIGVR